MKGYCRNCSITPGNIAWVAERAGSRFKPGTSFASMTLLTMHNIFKSFRRKSESRCLSSVFDCPVLCHSRLKRSGAWWLKENGNGMPALLCAIVKGTLDNAFNRFIERDLKKPILGTNSCNQAVRRFACLPL
jgi:hypothetical protein